MKIHELLEEENIHIRLSSAWLKEMHGEVPVWSTTQKIPIKCTVCNGGGKIKILKILTYKECKQCKGAGVITKLNTVSVDFTKNEHEFIKETFINEFVPSYMNNASLDTTNIIPRNKIPAIFRKITDFINKDQVHLDKPGYTDITRGFKKVPNTNLVNLTVNKKTVEPVEREVIVKLIKRFSKFLYDIQRLPDVSIIAETRY